MKTIWCFLVGIFLSVFILFCCTVSYFLGLHHGSSAIKQNRYVIEMPMMKEILENEDGVLTSEIYMDHLNGEAVADVLLDSENAKESLKRSLLERFGTLCIDSLMLNVRVIEKGNKGA